MLLYLSVRNMGSTSNDMGSGLYLVMAWFAARSRQLLALAACLVIVGLSISPAAGALAPISQEFVASSPIAQGSIVSLDKNSSDNVSATTSSTANTIIGVVINSDSSPISL